MGSWSLNDMVDKIQGYHKIMMDFGFKDAGTGDKPWSHLFEHEDGSRIEMRGSEWELWTSKGEIKTGSGPKSLHRFLLKDTPKDKLLDLIVGEDHE